MLGIKHAVGVSSGTDALLVSLMALGVGPGDEVITSPFSFFASAGVVARLGAVPVFVDIDPDSFNIDPSKLEAAVSPRTKAIQPVDLYGQCADMDPILEVAKRRRVPVLEDACQAVGAAYRGRPAGTFGALSAFSFYPTKNLGAAGDAGAVTTDDDVLAAQVRMLRLHGGTRQYHHDRVGGNFRLDAVQAAVLNAKLPRLAGWNERRRSIAARYGELLRQRCWRRQDPPSRRDARTPARLPPVRRSRRRSRRGEGAACREGHQLGGLLPDSLERAELLSPPRPGGQVPRRFPGGCRGSGSSGLSGADGYRGRAGRPGRSRLPALIQAVLRGVLRIRK